MPDDAVDVDQSIFERAGTEAIGVLNRRELIGGVGASVILSSSVKASDLAEPSIRVIRDEAKPDEFGVSIAYPTMNTPNEMVLFRRVFTDRRADRVADGFPKGIGPNSEKPAFDRLQSFRFAAIRFADKVGPADDAEYSVQFKIEKIDEVWQILVGVERKGLKSGPVFSNPVGITEFLSTGAEFSIPLKIPVAQKLVSDIFGPTLEIKKKEKPPRNAKDPVLTLVFSLPPASQRRGYGRNEPRLTFRLSSGDQAQITAFDGSLVVSELKIERVSSAHSEGARRQERDLQEQIRREKSMPVPPDAWVGVARNPDKSEAGAPTVLFWSEPESAEVYRLGPVASKQGGDCKASPVAGPCPPFAIALGQAGLPRQLVLRQTGVANLTQCTLRAPFNASIKETSGAFNLVSAFPLVDAELTRQNRRPAPSNGRAPQLLLEETLVGRLSERDFMLDTAFGPLAIHGDPAPPEPPPPGTTSKAKDGGARPEVPDYHPLGRPLSVRETFTEKPAKGLTQFHAKARARTLTHFDARALLRQMFLALPDQDSEARRKEAGRPSMMIESSGVWSRLDFNGTEIAFQLPLAPPDQQVPPSARGLVMLGVAPAPLLPLIRQPTRLPQLSIALDGATLRTRRSSDNLALTFQFRGLALELGADDARIVPNRRLTGGGHGRIPASQDMPETRFDDRPRLIVNFPPQHVAEKVYYRQINTGVTLPPTPGLLAKAWIPGFVNQLRALRLEKDPSNRRAIRARLAKVERERIDDLLKLNNPAEGDTNDLASTQAEHVAEELRQARAKVFHGLLDTLASGDPGKWESALGKDKAPALLERWKTLPEDQRTMYLGASSQAMDPDVRVVLQKIWLAATQNSGDANSRLDEQIQRLPSSELPPDILEGLRLRAAVAAGNDTAKQAQILKELTFVERCNQSREFREFSDFYRRVFANFRSFGGVKLWPSSQTSSLSEEAKNKLQALWDTLSQPGRWIELKNWPEDYEGRRALEARFIDPVKDSGNKLGREVLATLRGAYDAANPDEPFDAITPARLSGPSRLVFAIDSGGGSFDAASIADSSEKTEDREEVRSIGYSLESLTDWGRFDLVVTRRAHTLEAMPGDRVPHDDMRAIEHDAKSILAFQRIRPGNSIQGRMDDIRKTLTAPGEEETALEIPFRLYLSPDQFGRFRTRRAIPQDVLSRALNDRTGTKLGIDPALWSAALHVASAPPVVRAVWSDDFRPETLTNRAPPPQRGPFAPWFASLEPAAKSALSNDAIKFRTALDAYDRHELVALTSVYGLPSMGRRSEALTMVDSSQFEPPEGYRLGNIRKTAVWGQSGDTAGADLQDLSGIYNPSSLSVQELRLTAWGGTLRHDSSFVPPAAPILDDTGSPLFDALSIERWRQVTVLGRDIEVEVVYKGYLFPIGIPAALVKLTERRFVRDETRGGYYAYLIQRKFIRIGNPEKAFPALGQPDGARRMPVSQLRMLTRETPDIVDPDLPGDSLKGKPLTGLNLTAAILPNGRIDFAKTDGAKQRLSGLCFWPRTKSGQAGNVPFEFALDGDTAAFRMPMVFVDNVAATTPEVMRALAAAYQNDEVTPKSLRSVSMLGARRRYADENRDGECHFETDHWVFGVEGQKSSLSGDASKDNADFTSNALLQGVNQPPFYPYVASAKIRVGQAERMVGRPLGAKLVQFWDGYRKDGFPIAKNTASKGAYHEAYLEITDKEPLKLDMGDAGDRSGGLGRPAMDVRYLSRRFGLLPKDLLKPVPPSEVTAETGDGGAPAAPKERADKRNGPLNEQDKPPPPFNLEAFFSDDAKILGLISFKDLLNAAGSAVPELKESVEAATEETAAYIRVKILPPIEQTLKRLQDMWESARLRIEKESGPTHMDLNTVYPDLSPSLIGLLVAVERAKAAEGLALVGAMTEVQGAGRKFVNVLKHIASDPVAPLREEVRKQFRIINHDLQVISGNLAKTIDSLLAEAKKDVVDALESELKALSAQDVSLLFSLPVPLDVKIGDLSEVKRPIIDSANRAALQSIVSEINKIDGSNIDTVISNALGKAISYLQTEIDGNDHDIVTNDKIKRYKEKAVKIQNQIVEIKKKTYKNQKHIEQEIQLLVPGPLRGVLFGSEGVAVTLRGVAVEIEQELQRIDSSLLNRLAVRIGKGLETAFRSSTQFAVKTACQEALMPLLDSIKALLPEQREKTLNTVVTALRLKPEQKSEIQPLVDAYENLRGIIGKVAPKDVCSMDGKSSKEALEQIAVLGDALPTLALLESKIDQAVCIKANAQATKAYLKVSLREKLGPTLVDTIALAEAIQSLYKFGQEKVDDEFNNIATALDNIDRKLPTENALRPLLNDGKEIVSALRAVLTARQELVAAALTKLKKAQDGKLVDAQGKPLGPEIAIAFLALVLKGYSYYENAPDDAVKAAKETFQTELVKYEAWLKQGLVDEVARLRTALISMMGPLLADANIIRSKVDKVLSQVLGKSFNVLHKQIYAPIKTERDNARNALTGPGGDKAGLSKLVKLLLPGLRSKEGEVISDIFAVPEGDKDRLDEDTKFLEKHLCLAKSGCTVLQSAEMAKAYALIKGWSDGTASPLVLLGNIDKVMTAVLRADLSQLIDLNQIRREVDEVIRSLVPARIHRSYDLKIHMKDLGMVLFTGSDDATRKLGLPMPHPRGLPETLVIRAIGDIDLRDPQNSTFRAEGYLPGFALRLLPVFDVVTLMFPPAMFTAGSGQSFNIALKVGGVELGEKVQFIKQLESILPAPKDGNGFYVRFLTGRGNLGLVAGYALPVSPLTLGNMYIDDLALNVAAELPFDSGEARFVLSISRPEAPFMIAAAPYAGAGHLGLIANAKRIVGFEASFQFGGGGGFSFGPLKGKGRISVGIYVRKTDSLTELYGLFFAGGSARIACFGVGASLFVRMSQSGGDAEGEAIFTFSFSIGIKDIEYSVPVWKKEKGSGSSKKNNEESPEKQGVLDLNSDEYRDLTARQPVPTQDDKKRPYLENLTVCRGVNLRKYQSYFTLLPAAANPKNAETAWIMP